MKKAIAITCIFLDISGVLLTDRWDHKSNKLAAKVFDLNPDKLENQHIQTSSNEYQIMPYF